MIVPSRSSTATLAGSDSRMALLRRWLCSSWPSARFLSRTFAIVVPRMCSSPSPARHDAASARHRQNTVPNTTPPPASGTAAAQPCRHPAALSSRCTSGGSSVRPRNSAGCPARSTGESHCASPKFHRRTRSIPIDPLIRLSSPSSVEAVRSAGADVSARIRSSRLVSKSSRARSTRWVSRRRRATRTSARTSADSTKTIRPAGDQSFPIAFPQVASPVRDDRPGRQERGRDRRSAATRASRPPRPTAS